MGTRATAKQRVYDVRDFILTHEIEQNIAPSLREIATHFGVSIGTISTALARGLELGILERRGDAKYRAIFATETPCTIDKKIKHLERQRYLLRMSVSSLVSQAVSL